MHLLLRLSVIGGLAWAGIESTCLLRERRPERVQGTYLEGRSASVFAGACHVNGETASQGRHALLGWSIEEGAWSGVDLSGVRVAVALNAEGNLAEDRTRRSRVWIDAPGKREVEATRTWLLERHGETLGRFLAVEAADVELRAEGEEFALTVPGTLELRGRLDPDRSCCTMPEKVWYEPLARVDEPLVGYGEVCSFAGAGEDVPWSHPGQNNAFVARFEDAPAPAAATQTAACCSQP